MFGAHAITAPPRAPCRAEAERLRLLVEQLTAERQRDRRTIRDLEEALGRVAEENARLRSGDTLSEIPCPQCSQAMQLDRSTRADGQIVDYRGRCVPCGIRIDASGIGEESARDDLRVRWSSRAKKGQNHANNQ